jgi:hypothetical protein
MNFNFKKTFLVFCLAIRFTFGIDSQDSLIFSSEKIANFYNVIYKQNKGFNSKSWLHSIDIANQFVSNFSISKKPNCSKSQNFYIYGIIKEVKDEFGDLY